MSSAGQPGAVRACRTPVAVLAGLLLAGLAGCESAPKNESRPISTWRQGAPQPAAELIDAGRVPSYDDIVGVHCLWPSWPWLRDGAGKAVGFRTPVYFFSGGREKGVFVDGTIRCWLNVLEPRPDGKWQRTPLHEWRFSKQEAMGFRVRKRVVGGHYYGFLLTWPDQLDLSGKMVEVQFGYDRKDGRTIRGGTVRWVVPRPGDSMEIVDSREAS